MEQTIKEVTETKLYKGKVTVKFQPANHSYWVDGKRKTGVTTIIGIKDKSVALQSWQAELVEEFLMAKIGEKITQEDIDIACNLHNERKEAAADIGKEIHSWCEAYIKHKLKKKGYEKNPEMPESENVLIGVSAFLDWEKEHKVKFVSSERLLFSKKYDYVGTMDIEAIIDGDLCLVDLKSSNGLYNGVNLQTAAYVKADEEESGKNYKGRWAVRLSKETEKDYMAKMKRKQDRDIRRGKEPREIPAYQVFEAKYLDGDMSFIDRDFKAFINAKALHQFEKETGFWASKK